MVFDPSSLNVFLLNDHDGTLDYILTPYLFCMIFICVTRQRPTYLAFHSVFGKNKTAPR